MEDEGLVLSNPALAALEMDDWRLLGVDVVRIHARWWEIAPAQTAATKPAGFNAANHLDPQYNWAKLDTAVGLVRGAGINVMLSITGPGPLWSSGDPKKREPRYKPKPAEYASFARAVATPLQGPGQPLPALERAQPEGLAAAAVAEAGPQLDPGLAAHLPRPRARRLSRRSRPPTRARRS